MPKHQCIEKMKNIAKRNIFGFVSFRSGLNSIVSIFRCFGRYPDKLPKVSCQGRAFPGSVFTTVSLQRSCQDTGHYRAHLPYPYRVEM